MSINDSGPVATTRYSGDDRTLVYRSPIHAADRSVDPIRCSNYLHLEPFLSMLTRVCGAVAVHEVAERHDIKPYLHGIEQLRKCRYSGALSDRLRIFDGLSAWRNNSSLVCMTAIQVLSNTLRYRQHQISKQSTCSEGHDLLSARLTS